MKNLSRIAWIIFGIVTIFTLFNLFRDLASREAALKFFELITIVMDYANLAVFVFLAALILSRQPHNVIGWLLIIPSFLSILPVDSYIRSFTSPPAQPPVLLILALWYYNMSWLLVIFPIFFILMLFPTGRPTSPRWRWLVVAGLVMIAIFLLLDTFSPAFELTELGWSFPNPIGFPSSDIWDKYFSIFWPAALFSLTALSVVSLFVRYRHAALVEREQIRWFLYACTLFAVIYISYWWINDQKTIIHDIWKILLDFAILAIPTAIAVAILRYRLWDIDVIIRRTLIYSLLTAILALVFFGGVAMLQQVFGQISGSENSPIAIVISTLAITAMFNPLRIRIQTIIDRRFYRQKYDTQQVLARFALTARNETDLDMLTAELVRVAQETMQPDGVSLWLRQTEGQR